MIAEHPALPTLALACAQASGRRAHECLPRDRAIAERLLAALTAAGFKVLDYRQPGRGKLPPAAILDIMGASRHLSCAALAARYGVSPVAIHYVRTGRAHTRLTGLPKRPKGERVLLDAAE